MKRLPAPSTVTPAGILKLALVAGPPSPLNPADPLPAAVVMTCVVASTRRMRLLLESAMKRLPYGASCSVSIRNPARGVDGQFGPCRPSPRRGLRTVALRLPLDRDSVPAVANEQDALRPARRVPAPSTGETPLDLAWRGEYGCRDLIG